MKASQTRKTILKAAFEWASEVGLDGLSIGGLAERVGISKSGLFVHFGSKEELQHEILRFTSERFVCVVLNPLENTPRGLERIKGFYSLWWENWFNDENLPGICVFGQAATRLSILPENVQNQIRISVTNITQFLAEEAEVAKNRNELNPQTDSKQFALEIYALLHGMSTLAHVLPESECRTHAQVSFQGLIERTRFTN